MGEKKLMLLTVSLQITTGNSTEINDFVGIIMLTISGKILLLDHIATLLCQAVLTLQRRPGGETKCLHWYVKFSCI